MSTVLMAPTLASSSHTRPQFEDDLDRAGRERNQQSEGAGGAQDPPGELREEFGDLDLEGRKGKRREGAPPPGGGPPGGGPPGGGPPHGPPPSDHNGDDDPPEPEPVQPDAIQAPGDEGLAAILMHLLQQSIAASGPKIETNKIPNFTGKESSTEASDWLELVERVFRSRGGNLGPTKKISTTLTYFVKDATQYAHRIEIERDG